MADCSWLIRSAKNSTSSPSVASWSASWTGQRSDVRRRWRRSVGLATTAGVQVVHEVIQVRPRPHPATCLGSGKIEELAELIEAHEAELVVFDNNLTPAQSRNLEEALQTIIVDRSEVILDIFATRAQTYEAKLQVELAQLLYFRPRLKRMWTHLERIEGGIGTGRGPGERQIETDRRLIDRRVSELRRRLKEVESRRRREVARRADQLTVSLVGYTNSGKSTLMQVLAGADVLVADKLFATLDTRTRRWEIPGWGDVLLSDTVGFVRNLPHHLVASFRSTLEETRQADLLLHVADAGHPASDRPDRNGQRRAGRPGSRPAASTAGAQQGRHWSRTGPTSTSCEPSTDRCVVDQCHVRTWASNGSPRRSARCWARVRLRRRSRPTSATVDCWRFSTSTAG